MIDFARRLLSMPLPGACSSTTAKRRYWPASMFFLLLLAATACDHSSPTEPEPPPPPPQASNIVFADPEELAAHRDEITMLLEETFEMVSRVLPVGGVQFTVFADARRAIPGWGLGGYAPGPTNVDIVVDIGYSGLAQVLADRLPPITAHELHHAARWRGPGYGSTLLENMVSEGLADHFAVQLLGAELPWTDAFPEDQTAFYLNRARSELDSSTFNFNAWFFGGFGLPQWTGYTLGYRLVRDYLMRNPGSSAASLVNAPASLFRPE